MKTFFYTCRIWLILAFVASTHTALGQTFKSGNQRVNILELYTSEGCSSCPPADRWLSQLKTDPRLWKELIPLAFHVDYWDYIGWQDRFAEPQFAQRQRIYARQNSLSTVYTPGLLLNGQEWRAWFYQPSLKTDKQPAGNLEVNLAEQKLTATFTPLQTKRKDMLLNIAILGFDLSSQVDAGENSGRKLTHDFVVLEHKIVKMKQQALAKNLAKTSTQTEPSYTTSLALPKVSSEAQRQALAVWVNSMDNLQPVQATGGWIE